MDIKEVFLRALKTFWQTTAASLMVEMPSIVELIPSGWAALKPVIISVVVGAIAAGLSAAWNGVLAPIFEKYKNGGVDTDASE